MFRFVFRRMICLSVDSGCALLCILIIIIFIEIKDSWGPGEILRLMHKIIDS